MLGPTCGLPDYIVGMVAYTEITRRNRRARSLNSGCRRRSPRSLEFCTDFWRMVPSIGPGGVLRSINVETLARSVDIIGYLSSFLEQNSSG